ncbi:MAG TPA: twin-arginine translocation signal domain-containing protein [Chitinispirillaceae bacterium]|nr:twin-arginine translocation signal domain-containing protein [Chitinispirillaceae bacterium]HEX3018756.1 twin-arginine translocation signal domain-containing protein [Chitinispirillaceae bacterium]
MKNDSTISRRTFLKGTAATAAVTIAQGATSNAFAQQDVPDKGPGNKWPGRVVINFDKNAVTMDGAKGTAVPEMLKTMVDKSIQVLTEKEDIGEAWKAVFPASLTAQSIIAIKIPLGCADQKIAPHWSFVKAITDGLQKMDFNGTKFPGSNITIYDMRCNNRLADYGYTSANFGNVKIVYDSEGTGATDGAKGLQYAKSLKAANFLINVFRPGGHGAYVEGLTLGFKNHYGTYKVDHNASSAPGYLRDINCTGVVLNKNVLSVCYGIFGAAESSGSPGSSAIPYYYYARKIDSTITNESYPPCTIIMSTDPITAEMQTIKMMRLAPKEPKDYTVASMPKYLKASGGVSDATDDKKTYNIGIIDESKMDIRQIINGQVIGTVIKNNRTALGGYSPNIGVHKIKGQNVTLIHYSLPDVKIGSEAKLDIFDLRGSLVRSLSGFIAGAVNNVSWDEKDTLGKLVNNGTYILRLSSGKVNLSEQFTIIR